MDDTSDSIGKTIEDFVYRAKTSPAGALIRACAFFVDCLPVSILALILSAIAAAVTGFSLSVFSIWTLRTISFGLVYWLWCSLWESSKFQATPGKLLYGLRVISTNRSMHVDFKRASFRSALKFLPCFKAHALVLAILLAVSWFGAKSPRAFLGPIQLRRFLPYALILVGCFPLIPNWTGNEWRHGRRYSHDRLSSTMVRAPLRTAWWRILLQWATIAAVVCFALPKSRTAILRLNALNPARTRGEIRVAVGRHFAPRFERSPMRLSEIVLDDGRKLPVIGDSLRFETNFTGVAVLSRSSKSATIPFTAFFNENGDLEASFSGDVTAAFRSLLIENTTQAAPVVSTAKEKPAPIRPGGREENGAGIDVRFEAAEIIPWPNSAKPKAANYLLALDFTVANKSGDVAFVADWDARCKIGNSLARQVWLDDFDPIQGQLSSRGRITGTLLFALPAIPPEVAISWLGLDFSARFADRKPGVGK